VQWSECHPGGSPAEAGVQWRTVRVRRRLRHCVPACAEKTKVVLSPTTDLPGIVGLRRDSLVQRDVEPHGACSESPSFRTSELPSSLHIGCFPCIQARSRRTAISSIVLRKQSGGNRSSA